MNSPANDDWTTSPGFGDFDSDLQPQRRGMAWIAWIAIVLTIGIELIPHSSRWQQDGEEPTLIVWELQAKYLVGVKQLPITKDVDVREQIEGAFGEGAFRQRLIGIVLIGDLIGPADAKKELTELEEKITNGPLVVTEKDRRLIGLYQKTLDARLDNKPAESSLSDDERSEYRTLFPELLKWVGSLALSPAGMTDKAPRKQLLDQASRTFYVSLGIFTVGTSGMICGILLQVLWWSFLMSGRLTSHFGPTQGHGAVYAETFAVWMILYMSLGIIIPLTPLVNFGIIVFMIAQVASLSALIWPVWRGISWADVRQDIGLCWDRQGWWSAGIGIGGYLSALPMVAVAMVIMLLMMQVAAQLGNDAMSTPSHPIAEPVLRGNWIVRLQVLLVAVFAAVPEEIMFRGVLYRHLRAATSRWRYIPSVLGAACISSFIFAVIHPQGIMGIPFLMALAIAFAVIREWRGSLVPCMIAHAMVNAVTCLFLNLLAD